MDPIEMIGATVTGAPATGVQVTLRVSRRDARLVARSAMVMRYVVSCEYRLACLDQAQHATTTREYLTCLVDACHARRRAHWQWRAIQRLSA